METLEINIDGALKTEAQQVLSAVGLTLPQAVSMFLRTVVHDRTMPGMYRVPNETTKAAMRELERNDLPVFHSVDEMMRALREDD